MANLRFNSRHENGVTIPVQSGKSCHLCKWCTVDNPLMVKIAGRCEKPNEDGQPNNKKMLTYDARADDKFCGPEARYFTSRDTPDEEPRSMRREPKQLSNKIKKEKVRAKKKAIDND